MATSLSNETSSASLVELSQNPLLCGSSGSQSWNLSNASKTAVSQSKGENSGTSANNNQSTNVASSSNQSANTSQHKTKNSDNQYASSVYSQQSSNFISSSAGLGYPFLYPNSIFPGLAQTSSQPQYNYQGAGAGGSMQSSSSSSGTQSNRRGGKKKAPTTQSQNSEIRLFFNLRRRDTLTQSNKGSSHFYKPKNPPSLMEWFKKLTVEERVNALSTVNPHLTETFIIMHQRIDQKGQSIYALRERSYFDYKNFQNQSYLLQYPSFPQILSQSSGDSLNLTFDENFYQRVQSETELQTIRSNEREKICAEQELMKHVRLTHYFEPLDTLTVSEEIVQDAELFFKLMSYATNNQAFSSQCQFVFDTKLQQNVIEYPNWFKPKSFHSFATWVIVSLEENLWAHYNYDNNVNLGTAKVNELSTLFREKTDRGAQDVDIQELSKFWKDMNDQDKKALINQLQINAVKEVEQHENNLQQSGNGFQTKTHKSGHSKNMHFSISIKERRDQSEKSNSQIQTEQELKYYIDQSQRQGYEQELITQLMYTKFGNTHQRQVLICQTFLDLIKKKYKDDLMENLLLEESVKQTKSQGQGKKKKKKGNQQQQQANNIQHEKSGQSHTSESNNTTVDYSEEQPKPKTNKKKGKQEAQTTDKQMGNNMGSTDTANSSNYNVRKKKKNQNQQQKLSHNSKKESQSRKISIVQQDSHSCDEKESNTKKTYEIESEIKSTSMGVQSTSNLYENTTAHQSNNSNSNSSATIASSTPNNGANILQIQSSKSLDLNPVIKSKSQNSSHHKQMKPISKIESKNLQILQSSSQNNDRGTKGDKKTKPSTSHNTYSDNIIFSEDDRESKKIIDIKELYSDPDSKKANENISEYVLQLTNEMIMEVCRKFESNQSPNNRTNEQVETMNKKEEQTEQTNSDLYKLGALPQSVYQQRKRSFYKKQRKESNNMHIQNEHANNQVHHHQGQHFNSDKRKISFNNGKKCFKDDKKFSEDYAAEVISNNSYQKAISNGATQSSVATLPNNAHHMVEDIGRKSSQTEVQKHQQKPQRKGFGIHLKGNDKVGEDAKKQGRKGMNHKHEDNADQPNEWAKGTVKQPDPQQNKKKQHQNKQKKDASKEDGNTFRKNSQAQNTQDIDRMSNATKEDQNGNKDNQQNKKRRNRKKPKMNNIDIMNNFMKGLQTSQEEVKHIIESKSSSGNNHQFKKRNSNYNVNQQKTNRAYVNDTQSERVQTNHKIESSNVNEEQKQPIQQYKQKTSKNTVLNAENNEMQTNNQHFKKQDNKMLIKHKSSHDNNDGDYHHISSKQNQGKHGNNFGQTRHHQKRNNQKTQAKHIKSHNIPLVIEEKHQEVTEKVQPKRIECQSEKSSCSIKEKVSNADLNQTPNVAPFRLLQFNQGNDWENNSMTDATNTTNTAADTSLENANQINGEEKDKEQIVIQDQSNHIQVSLTDSIDAQNLLKNNALAFSLQQFSQKLIQNTMSQTLHDIQEASMIPPQIQSPCSNLSVAGSIYTPQSYHYQSTQQDFVKMPTGFQSYQNTPSKNNPSSTSKNPFKGQNLQLSSQVSQISQEGCATYRTPPQVSKKNNGPGSFNYSSNGGAYRKSTNGQQNQNHSKHYQIKDYQQPIAKQNSGFIQPPPMSPLTMGQDPQLIHYNSDPNAYYYQDNPMMNVPNSMGDMYYPRPPQGQVFHYDERNIANPVMIGQPNMYYPPSPMPMNNFNPGIIPQNEVPPQNPFYYKRMNQPYYDQSQDLILQIFNSIKFNQQSLSPIPQVMSSPPPLIDLQASQNSAIDQLNMAQKIDSQMWQTKENAFYEKFDQEIRDYIQQVQRNLNTLKPERDLIINKIQTISEEVFAGQNPKLELFGSLITGLALESSDMDLAVTGLYIEDRFAVICELNKLATALQGWECLESFKSIETASIPVIKMKVDLQKLREIEMAKTCGIDSENQPINEEYRYLSVDITFDDSSSQTSQNPMNPNLFYQELMGQNNITKTHLGLQSCALVQYYIANYQNLKEVAILLKQFLALHKYNSPYYGGLSSYSTVILLVAYMNYFDLRANMNLTPSRLLMGFLDYYGNYFDPSSFGINVSNDGSFYQLSSLQDSNFVILDPLNLSNNTTRNSYLTKEILQKFQCAFNNLKSLILKNPQLQNAASLSSETPALEKANSQDQNSSIPFERTSPLQTDFQVSDNKLQYSSFSRYEFEQKDWSPEEVEASHLAKGTTQDNLNEVPPFSKVNLLETFFASEAQPVAASQSASSSQQEPTEQNLVTSQNAVQELTKLTETEGQDDIQVV